MSLDGERGLMIASSSTIFPVKLLNSYGSARGLVEASARRSHHSHLGGYPRRAFACRILNRGIIDVEETNTITILLPPLHLLPYTSLRHCIISFIKS